MARTQTAGPLAGLVFAAIIAPGPMLDAEAAPVTAARIIAAPPEA